MVKKTGPMEAERLKEIATTVEKLKLAQDCLSFVYIFILASY